MIAVHVRALSSSSSVLSLDSLGRTDWSGLLVRRETSTNNVRSSSRPLHPLAPRAVERTIQHAVSRYDNLLRRLAD